MKPEDSPDAPLQGDGIESQRRALLKRLARFTAVTAPAVTLLLAATGKSRRAQAASLPVESSRQFKSRESGVDLPALLSAAVALPDNPQAQSFRAAFGIGDGARIEGVDAAGVCLAAIKALAGRVEALESGILGRSG